MNQTMVGEKGVDWVDFTIPFLPPSVNQLWTIIRRPGQPLDWQLTTEARLWRSQTLPMIPKLKATESSFTFRLDATFTYNFYYKNGKMKKFDTHNLLKFLTDTIAMKQGFDDSFIKSGSWSSVHSEDRVNVECVLMKEPV